MSKILKFPVRIKKILIFLVRELYFFSDSLLELKKFSLSLLFMFNLCSIYFILREKIKKHIKMKNLRRKVKKIAPVDEKNPLRNEKIHWEMKKIAYERIKKSHRLFIFYI